MSEQVIEIYKNPIYKVLITKLVTIFPLVEEDVGMMLDGLLQEAVQAIADIDPWTRVEDGLPEPDAVRIINGLRHSIYYLTDGEYEYAVALYRKDREGNLWWDDGCDGVDGVTRWLKITPPKGA